MKLQIKSIQIKIVLWAGLCFFLAMAVFVVYAVTMLSNTTIQAAEEHAIAISESHAAHIRAEIEVALDTARTLAHTFEAVKSDDIDLSRNDVNAMLKRVLIENPHFIAIYTIWEPNAFDGQDAAYAELEGHDETGRFIPDWSRDAGGHISIDPSIDYEQAGPGDYYQVPKNTRNEAIIDPYVYSLHGEDTLITSLVVPIIVYDQFYGIVGVDLKLEFLQELANEMDVYDGTAKLALISNNGTLSGVTGQPELVGEYATALHDDFEEDIAIIQNGEQVAEMMGDTLEVFMPIRFGHTTTPWSANVLIPKEQIIAAATAAMWNMIGIGAALLLVILVLLWIISGTIARPIRMVADVAHKITSIDLQSLVNEMDYLAQGDLTRSLTINTESIEVKSKDEVGQLAGAFNTMIERLHATGDSFCEMSANLRNMICGVMNTADGVRSASNNLQFASEQSSETTSQIATTIQQVVSGTQQQTENITKTAVTVNQMGRSIDGVAQGAEELAAAVNQTVDLTAQMMSGIQQVTDETQKISESIANAAEVSRKGASIVADNVKGMAEIKKKVDLSSQKVAAMGELSEQIGTIVETIDDIASQTNVLALNASIEAAQAGEHSKGFTVVADEVCKLAERTVSATKEIGELIGEVQVTITGAVSAMAESASEVDTGTRLVNNAGDALSSILTAVEEVNEQVENISTASNGIKSSSEELVSAMDSVSAVVKENEVATEEMAAGPNEVTQAFENIASISKENSAAVEEVSAAAEEMAAQVKEVSSSSEDLSEMMNSLVALVATFQLSYACALEQKFEFFKDSHIQWMGKLDKMIVGRIHFNETEIPDHHDCVLGAWYYGSGSADMCDFAGFDSLEAPHARLHAQVKEAVAAYNRGDEQLAEKASRNVEELLHEVVDLLNQLEFQGLESIKQSSNGSSAEAKKLGSGKQSSNGSGTEKMEPALISSNGR